MSTQETKLKAIADAIREKDGSTAPIPANDFAARILALDTSGLPDDVCTIDLNANPPEGGTVSGGGLASKGMTVTVKATPADGYEFNEWQENEVALTEGDETAYTFKVGYNTILTADFKVKKTSRLPDGYTEVQYIESDGSGQVGVNSGKSVSMYHARVVMDIQVTADYTNHSEVIVGSNANGNYYCLLKRDQGKINYTFGSSSSGTGSVSYTFPASKVILDVNFKSNTLKIGDVSVTLASRAIQAASSSIFFFNNPGMSSSYATPIPAKLYSAQIYNDGANSTSLVGDYVPCIRDSDGAVGLYNLVNNEFNANSLSGTLTAGPSV